MPKKRVGIALGGGGARGFAHLGILRTLKKAGIDIEVYAGTSMGAIIAASFLQRVTFQQSQFTLRDFVLKYGSRFNKLNYVEAESGGKTPSLTSRLMHTLGKSAHFISFFHKTYLEDDLILQDICKDFIYEGNLEDLPHKMYVCTVDVVSGKPVFIKTGNIRQAIRAGMGIPGYFKSIDTDKHKLYDAQMAYPVPVQIFEREPVDILIACDVTPTLNTQFQPKSGFDLLFRQSDILISHALSEVYNCSDVVIRPELGNIHWTEFQKIDTIFKQGAAAAEAALPKILEAFEKPSKPMSKRPWHNFGFPKMDRVEVIDFPPYIK